MTMNVSFYQKSTKKYFYQKSKFGQKYLLLFQNGWIIGISQ